MLLTIYCLVSVIPYVESDSICFQDLPWDGLAAPASALCGWEGAILSVINWLAGTYVIYLSIYLSNPAMQVGLPRAES